MEAPAGAPPREEIERYVAAWASAHPLSPPYVDCSTAVMLKILDGKCKMKPLDKVFMEFLYDQVRERPMERLTQETHELIARARATPDASMKEYVYERRVLAETMISRPVMKEFKAMIRREGLFALGTAPAGDAEEEED